MRKQVVSNDRIQLIKDSSRSGTYARVEIRSGDGGGDSVQRSEVTMMQDNSNNQVMEDLNSGTQQYKFSVKFDSSWQNISGWGIFLQLHGDDSYSTNPAIAFSATDKIRLNMRTGDITQNKGAPHELSNGDLNKGHWIDFVMTVKFAANNTGYITVLRRDEGQTA